MTTFSLREDIADEFNWTSIGTTRDDNGQILHKDTLYDNGTRRAETYEDGVRRAVEMTDLGPNGETSDVRSWETIQIEYDEQGQMLFYYRLDDNGVQTQRGYEDGVLRSVEQLDVGPNGGPSDAKTWERIETFYDENGDLASVYRLNDDGTQSFKDYEAGVLRRVEQLDVGPNGGPSDAKNWERIVTDYDQNGEIQNRLVVNDDGTTAETFYQNGVRQTVERLDRGPNGEMRDVKAWDMILSVFDETGTIYAKETLYDDGDVTSILYDPSLIFEGSDLGRIRLELDGDNSESWTVRETLYDQNNQVVEVNTYDDLYDLPPEYGLGLDPTF